MRATALLNRGGGAVAADEEISAKVEAALHAAGIDAGIELVEGGEAEAPLPGDCGARRPFAHRRRR